VISSFRFVSSSHDSALFIKCTDAGRIIMSLNIDDMIITSDDIDVILVLKRYSWLDILYRIIVRSLVYLSITCPDIAYVIHVVSQFVASLTTIHQATVLCILRYLQSTVFPSLLLSSTSSLELHAYSDANHDSYSIDRKSVTGFCICK